MCFGQNIQETTYQPATTQANQHSQHAETPQCNTLDLFKRLIYKDNLLHYRYSENKKLKMLMQQNASRFTPITPTALNVHCTQYYVNDAQGNMHVRYHECANF